MKLIKLGGSVITDKRESKHFNRKITRALAGEIKESHADVFLVHGAGSFGHILAEKYSLHRGFSENKQINAVAQVQRDVRMLNLEVLRIFIDEGFPAVSLAPGSFVVSKNGTIESMDTSLFEAYHAIGMVPLTFGDVVVDFKRGFSICSGDDIMYHLAKAFYPERAIFVVDVDGIFEPYVAGGGGRLLQEVNGDTLSTFDEMDSDVSDVTGGMYRKLKIMLEIANLGVDCQLLNGKVPGRLRDALEGRTVRGTIARGVKR